MKDNRFFWILALLTACLAFALFPFLGIILFVGVVILRVATLENTKWRFGWTELGFLVAVNFGIVILFLLNRA